MNLQRNRTLWSTKTTVTNTVKHWENREVLFGPSSNISQTSSIRLVENFENSYHNVGWTWHSNSTSSKKKKGSLAKSLHAFQSWHHYKVQRIKQPSSHSQSQTTSLTLLRPIPSGQCRTHFVRGIPGTNYFFVRVFRLDDAMPLTKRSSSTIPSWLRGRIKKKVIIALNIAKPNQASIHC